jgi:hypothetical protein
MDEEKKSSIKVVGESGTSAVEASQRLFIEHSKIFVAILHCAMFAKLL